MSDLYKEQLGWAQMIKDATPGACAQVETIELLEVAKEEEDPLGFDPADLSGCSLDDEEDDTVDMFITGMGECVLCHKTKRIWSGVCALCGADDEDLEKE